jgi:3-keto-disaccharide hydrolase
MLAGRNSAWHYGQGDLMNRHIGLIQFALICLVLALATSLAEDGPPASEEGFTSLFDGRSLAGWEGNLDVFHVDQGAIVGGSLAKRVARNEFLCTTDEFGDFELRLKFKLLGQGANGGVQFRSRRIPNHHEVNGYQADMGDGWWGSLYDESRRNKVLLAADAALVKRVLKRDDWNDYRIRCKGPRIQLWLNGAQTVDYTEPDASIERQGLVGLQIHGGGPSEAWYKDIRIKKL